ncbi:MAG: hypothetical protein Q8M98_11470 [Candidatus Cloacimonadaceae bacterium]|nr:hypothetical protein [Candidatus Cloacimonadaceae bacterium]
MFSGSDGSVFIAASIWNSPYRIQKVNNAGQLLFGTGLEIDGNSTQFLPDNAGGCYIGSVYRDVFLAHINSAGMHNWQITGLPICTEGSSQQYLWGKFYDNKVLLVWMDNRSLVSGIYAQVIETDGDMVFQENGLPLQNGLNWEIQGAQTKKMSDKTVVVWMQRDQYNGNYRIKMQMIHANGLPQFPQGGIDLTRNCLNQNTLALPEIFVTTNDEVFVSWWDSSIPGDTVFKTQLFSTTGDPLWGAGGLTISSLGEDSQVSLINDSFYIVFSKTMPNNTIRIWGQKITNGSLAWPDGGIQLVADHPEYPDASQTYLRSHKDYLVWNLENSPREVFALRFTSEGTPAQGFAPWGKQISQRQDNYSIGTRNTGLINDKLYCGWYESYHVGEGNYNVVYIQQVVSPDGALLINSPGLTLATMGINIGFTTDGVLNGWHYGHLYDLYKYSSAGELLSFQQLSLTAAGQNVTTRFLTGFEDGNMVLLARIGSSVLGNDRYYFINPEG